MDRVYNSMFGPNDGSEVTLSGEATEARMRPTRPEVVWITGIRADIVYADDQTQSAEYFLPQHPVLRAPVESPETFLLAAEHSHEGSCLDGGAHTPSRSHRSVFRGRDASRRRSSPALAERSGPRSGTCPNWGNYASI
jgi:hypothetical protein